MLKFISPRLRAPARLLLLGGAVVIVTGLALGWQASIGGAAIVVVGSVGYYLWGARDSDMGTIIGSRKLDERQLLRRLKVQALVGRVLSLAVAIACLAAGLAKMHNAWPLDVLVGVLGVTFVAGWAYYREDA
jgi:hypothetical protein